MSDEDESERIRLNTIAVSALFHGLRSMSKEARGERDRGRERIRIAAAIRQAKDAGRYFEFDPVTRTFRRVR